MVRYLGGIKRASVDILTVGKHTFTHMLMGLVYAWILREIWQELSVWYIFLSVMASVLPDADHFIYFLTYGKSDWYAREVRKLLRQGQIRTLLFFLKDNHKYNTGLATHNIYYIAGFFGLSLVSYTRDSKTGVVIFGGIVLHLLFDVVDDLWVLGRLNENWKRLRRKKQLEKPVHLSSVEKNL